jgi:hypothetical protein
MKEKERDIRVEMFRVDENVHPFVMVDYVILRGFCSLAEGIIAKWRKLMNIVFALPSYLCSRNVKQTI